MMKERGGQPPTTENTVLRSTTPAAVASGLAALGDDELVARCREGDRLAWRALYDRHAPALFRFMAALGVPTDDREDAAQDVFVAIYRSLGSFRGEAQFSTWMYRIAARHAGRLGRRRRLREVVGTLLAREPAPPAPPDPSETAASLVFVDRLLEKLSPKKRVVFVLFEIEGLPVDEIARVVGCPENTVWSRLHHARSEVMALARKRERAASGERAAAGGAR
jgi:RNA polymerase sigma-70 factor (ECF subfamily)